MERVKQLLAEWKNFPESGREGSPLALKLLEEVELLVHQTPYSEDSRSFYLDLLETTRVPSFLLALPTDQYRNRWAELVFIILQRTRYSLRDMMDHRAKVHPEKPLFRELVPLPLDWSYEQIRRHTREIATLFLSSSADAPRVAIYTENCLEGACTDLACLCYDIFITPLSPHFKEDVLLDIFDRLKITIALADTEERLGRLQKLNEKARVPFIIFSLLPDLPKSDYYRSLKEECIKISKPEIEKVVDGRPLQPSNRVATTMFTSGSTGLPKGVSFSIYNIVSKRFARSAALPRVGDQVFLCYLPLYHTFGRYLEMTGAIYWNGTYVFAGNTSAETLLGLFPKINPTGFISIPLRWQELYEKCQEKIEHVESIELKEQCVRDVVGTGLGWGLSAAGYLDPKVFRFFNHWGVAFCSGFGMTEATGGITMTPPGKYRDFSVGVPLPGVYTRLNQNSELEISGHYIARYLEDAGPGDLIPYPGSGESEYWLPTGDVFRIAADGYHQIIDRVKDIYKNNRGQTIAPQVLEKKFINVPGIRRTFLVGDNRSYNVLLIVPDTSDPIFESLKGENITEYFHQVVMSANPDVAPFERVVNFALLDRDFSQEKGELTPKGSYNRKTIENNFLSAIEALYTSNVIQMELPDASVTIPKWFFRDLGILETDILFQHKKLVNRRTNKTLTIRRIKGNTYQVGDFKYTITSGAIDLGVFSRQPRLWTGNAELAVFCPVKEGWDLSLGNIQEYSYMVAFHERTMDELPELQGIRDPRLIRVNQLLFRAFYFPVDQAMIALQELGSMFNDIELRLAEVLRQRLEALAFHPEEEIRVLAYRLILLKAPEPERVVHLPAFIESGLSFLNEKSIREIASSNFGKHRLDALKQRLYYYRTHLKWPANKKMREQFEDVIRMLYNFAILHLEYYVPVRAELSRWILHKQDPYLSKKAEDYFDSLANVFESSIEERTPKYAMHVWKSKLVFEHGISEAEQERITSIFQSTTFFHESILLTFNEKDFSLDDVPRNGIWILRLLAYKDFKHYRLSVNTLGGKHFDLHIVLSENPRFKPNPDLFYWLASLAGFPYGAAVAPLLGSNRPNLGILSTQYIGGLTAWDKIRELAEIHKSAGFIKPNAWKKIFIRAFSVLFKAWHHSGYQIVPGAISPANVAIPEMDFRESAVVLSLTGWSKYKNTLSFVEPILEEYYCKTAAVYPWCRDQLSVTWIFDACIEALGADETKKFLVELKQDLKEKDIFCFDGKQLSGMVDAYLENNLKQYYLPLVLDSAIDQYTEWSRMNPLTTPSAKEQTLFELMDLYRIHQYHEVVRYCFYRNTYFSDKSEEIRNTFDALLTRMYANSELLPIQLVELSDLQSAIQEGPDKIVFSRMVFPKLQREQKVDFMKIGESSREQLVVRFTIRDKTGKEYMQRVPIEPREIGQLYQLFFRENYPKEIRNNDHQQVVTDEDEKVIGGLTWHVLEDDIVLLDGIVVTSSLQGKGIAASMIENFFASMAARGVKIIKAHFLFGNYYLKHYFEVDKKWGALIKTLN